MMLLIIALSSMVGLAVGIIVFIVITIMSMFIGDLPNDLPFAAQMGFYASIGFSMVVFAGSAVDMIHKAQKMKKQSQEQMESLRKGRRRCIHRRGIHRRGIHRRRHAGQYKRTMRSIASCYRNNTND